MYNLNAVEIRTLNDFYALRNKQLSLGNLIQEHQRILELLYKSYCVAKYSCAEETIEKIINECLSKDSRFISGTFKTTGKPKFHAYFKDFSTHFFFINNLRNKFQHSGYVPTVIETDLSSEYLRRCVLFYFKYCIQKLRNDITSSDSISMTVLNELFPSPTEKENLVEKPKFYVILLIDSSGSMQFPFNKICNGNKEQGLEAVRKAMSLAQEKCLESLRGSAHCLKRCLWVYQYVFNEEPEVINAPKLLSPFGNDEVKKIKETAYLPAGLTALYTTIEEALSVTYDNYLRPAKENSRRIDKVSIIVITDGDDNYIDGVEKEKNVTVYNNKKNDKIKNIKTLLRTLGLVGSDFSETNLKTIQTELGFEVSISIDGENEKSLRQAFRTASTNAKNI